MTITGYIYDPVSGKSLARIENDTDVIDVTVRDGGKIATVRDGKLYDLRGELLGHLAPLDGDRTPAPAAFKALLQKKKD